MQKHNHQNPQKNPHRRPFPTRKPPLCHSEGAAEESAKPAAVSAASTTFDFLLLTFRLKQLPSFPRRGGRKPGWLNPPNTAPTITSHPDAGSITFPVPSYLTKKTIQVMLLFETLKFRSFEFVSDFEIRISHLTLIIR